MLGQGKSWEKYNLAATKKNPWQEYLSNDFKMEASTLNRIRASSGSTKNEFLDSLDQRIEGLVAGNHFKIFEFLKAQQAKTEQGEPLSQFEEEIDVEKRLLKHKIEEKIINLPDKDLGQFLGYLPKEVRQTVFVQRENYTIGTAIKALRKWKEDKVICFHVSDQKIKDNVLQAGEDGKVFFSTDLGKLYQPLAGAKYIYAFRWSKDKIENTRYPGAPAHFGQLAGAAEVEDVLPIFDKDDPQYQRRTLDSIGADFDASFQAAK